MSVGVAADGFGPAAERDVTRSRGGRRLSRRRVRPPAGDRRSTGVPPVLLLPALLGAAFLVLPSASLVARAPWTSLGDVLGTAAVRDALILSLITASSATALSLVLGVPLAWALARFRVRGMAALRAAVLLPLVLPPVAGGVALFEAFGRFGLLGRPLYQATDFQLPFTTAGVVVAEAFVAMPFLVVSAEGAFRTVDVRLEEAAMTLGASRATIFRRIVVPTVGPALVAGTVLCWARALGEFGATVTFAGNLQGTTQTLPLLVNQSFQTSLEQANAVSLVLMAISLLVLTSLRDRWLRTPSSAA